MFGEKLMNRNVLFYTDNTAVRDMVNNQTSRDKKAMQIIRPLVLTLARLNINLKMKYIEGSKNVLCDRISRFQVTPSLLEQYQMDPLPIIPPRELIPENWKLK